MFRDIKFGDFVLVYDGINRPYEKKMVCEVNDKTFKCYMDSKSYSKEDGKCILDRYHTFAFVIPYDEEKWNRYCVQVYNNKRKKKALEVIKNFYKHSCYYSVEDCELIAEMIKRIKVD